MFWTRWPAVGRRPGAFPVSNNTAWLPVSTSTGVKLFSKCSGGEEVQPGQLVHCLGRLILAEDRIRALALDVAVEQRGDLERAELEAVSGGAGDGRRRFCGPRLADPRRQREWCRRRPGHERERASALDGEVEWHEMLPGFGDSLVLT